VYPVFLGVFRPGAGAVPVMYQLAAPELRFVLADTEAHGVVTDTANLPKVREAVAGLDHVEWIAVRGGTSDASARPREIALEELLASPPQGELPDIAPNDLALLLYTSGTTGKPKGAMLSHANLIASAEGSAAAGELEKQEKPRVSISAMPMAHIFGVGVMNGGYLLPERLAGGYMVQMSWFEPEQMLRLIAEHRCAVMPAVPTMLAILLDHPAASRYDLSSLEEVVCGAAPLPVELAKAFMARFRCRVREIYGMTESTGLGSANRPSEPYRPGSAGRPYPNVELRIVGDDDQPLAVGDRGEVVLRGPSVMQGYWRRPDATADALRGGWLHTGDVGYLDDEGFLFLVDRKKDMIIRGGENIYPAEIEALLYEHPGVGEAAVVGVPDAVYGESVVAYVVRRAAAELSEEELRRFCVERTSKFKAPSRFYFLDALPKSGVGKILRRELRARAAAEPARS
jgi:long-chain acyl-CoA synthetase